MPQKILRVPMVQQLLCPALLGTSHAISLDKVENNSDHPHPPYLQKNMPPKYAIQRGSVWHKSRLKSRGFLPKIWHMDPPFMAYEPPPFMPYEPFYWGVGVVFNLLKSMIRAGGMALRSRTFSTVKHYFCQFKDRWADNPFPILSTAHSKHFGFGPQTLRLLNRFNDFLGCVPTTPDPNTSAKVSRYKWEAYRDTNWWCIYYFLPKRGHTFARVSR